MGLVPTMIYFVLSLQVSRHEKLSEVDTQRANPTGQAYSAIEV